MKFIATVQAYDALDQVYATAQVKQYADYEEGPCQTVMLVAATFPGEGLTDPRAWLQDVLVSLLERL